MSGPDALLGFSFNSFFCTNSAVMFTSEWGGAQYLVSSNGISFIFSWVNTLVFGISAFTRSHWVSVPSLPLFFNLELQSFGPDLSQILYAVDVWVWTAHSSLGTLWCGQYHSVILCFQALRFFPYIFRGSWFIYSFFLLSFDSLDIGINWWMASSNMFIKNYQDSSTFI